MKKVKQDYESPTSEFLEVRFEGFFCQSNGGLKNIDGGDVIDDSDLWS